MDATHWSGASFGSGVFIQHSNHHCAFEWHSSISLCSSGASLLAFGSTGSFNGHKFTLGPQVINIPPVQTWFNVVECRSRGLQVSSKARAIPINLDSARTATSDIPLGQYPYLDPIFDSGSLFKEPTRPRIDWFGNSVASLSIFF